MDIIEEVVKLAVVALFSGYFSASLALRGHRNKKWWEMRVSAYQSLIEALSDLSYYYDQKFIEHINSGTADEKNEKKFKELWEDSYHKIRKASDAGSFLFPIEVTSALRKLKSIENERHKSYFDCIEQYSRAADKCLDTVIISAKKELRIERTWL